MLGPCWSKKIDGQIEVKLIRKLFFKRGIFSIPKSSNRCKISNGFLRYCFIPYVYATVTYKNKLDHELFNVLYKAELYRMLPDADQLVLYDMYNQQRETGEGYMLKGITCNLILVWVLIHCAYLLIRMMVTSRKNGSY